MKKHQQFANADRYFACPHCGQALELEQNSLRCAKRHTYDLAKQGYVNLAPQVKQSANYHKTSFEKRQAFLEKGYYDHLYQAVKSCIAAANLQSFVDVGCGEGFYSRRLAKEMDADILAFDLSKESILLAARSEPSKSVKWFVGDLTHLPLQDQCVDGILDIFSPAHYQEFHRVLKPHGRVIKLIPGPNHLKELRQLAKEQLRKDTYDNQEMVAHFEANHQLVSRQLISKTLAITPEDAQILADMTPLFFHVDQTQLPLDNLSAITIEALLLEGKVSVPY
ncbi:putative RNA methyltransferase [Streptococcus oriscaviae]|uniref:Methyltransferase domain-containing protein n=1 Tax=Streptococcus oriscaviae TaxID=2781599 RepID=A0ABX7YM65_9STRE|nr:methyltransferase domain-containing protein [Streptococcus oriscaviae]QUE54747.1 methyltransferase domain-containing protein [Streptococcus oriscaviae]